jgi:methionine synthase II (cobalamin-independent)
MTVRWSSYAQSLSKKPVKGMLTGEQLPPFSFLPFIR